MSLAPFPRGSAGTVAVIGPGGAVRRHRRPGDMLVTEGRYRFEDLSEVDDAIYVFRHGRDATTS
jgi:hypothetical protein